MGILKLQPTFFLNDGLKSRVINLREGGGGTSNKLTFILISRHDWKMSGIKSRSIALETQ